MDEYGGFQVEARCCGRALVVAVGWFGRMVGAVGAGEWGVGDEGGDENVL